MPEQANHTNGAVNSPDSDKDKKLRINKIYELTYKLGPAIKSIRFEAEDESDAETKGNRFIRFIDGLTTSKATMVGRPKKFAIEIDEEMGRIKKLVDQGRNPFY